MKDYVFCYEGCLDSEMFLCSAKNGDEAMEKFKKHAGDKTIFRITVEDYDCEHHSYDIDNQ